MKAEFLQNFKVGDTPLPKGIVDAILAENDRDVEAAKKPFADYEDIKEQLATAREGLKAFEGVDVKELQGQIAKLTGELSAKEAEHQARLQTLEFDGALKDAIRTAGGRSAAAIMGELGQEKLDALRASKNREADIKAALEGLKRDSEYLFDTGETPPPYAAGTGTGGRPDAGLDAIRAAAGLPNK